MKITLSQCEIKQACIAYVIAQGFPVKAEDLEANSNADEMEISISNTTAPKKTKAKPVAKKETVEEPTVEATPETVVENKADTSDITQDIVDEPVEDTATDEAEEVIANPFAMPAPKSKGIFGKV